MKISIIVPNFNGKKFLEPNLPALLKEVNRVHNSEIIVSDDGSTDDSVEFIKNKYSEIKVIEHNKNSGFASTCNRGIKRASGKYLLLINNDVEVFEPFIESCLSLFNEEVFAVVPSILLPDNPGTEEGFTALDFSRGNLNVLTPNSDKFHFNFNKSLEIPHAVGACAFYNRKKLNELGNFDEFFSPYFWEDVDLSFKALKKGWKILYNPSVKVNHFKSRTVKKHYCKEIRNITSIRNKFLCTWIHLDSRELLLKHYHFLHYFLKVSTKHSKREYLIGFNSAHDKLSGVFERRKTLPGKLSMSEILKKYSINNYE